jgi:hypothetical protein
MAIYRILQNSPLSPEDISRLVTAYEATLKALGLTDRTDPITDSSPGRSSKSARPAFAIPSRFRGGRLRI